METLVTTVPQSQAEKQARRDVLVARAKALGLRGQNELCRRAGVNPQNFSRCINDDRYPMPSAWPKLERYLRRREARSANGVSLIEASRAS